MIFYAITDRKFDEHNNLLSQIKKYLSLGVDWIQIREKDLSDKELLKVLERTVNLSRKKNTKIFVNNRSDLSFLSRCEGVHLSADSIPIGKIKDKFPNLMVIKSCHSLEQAKKTEKEGADFVTLSPIFEPLSKKYFTTKPLGIKTLFSCVNKLKVPVIALGGIDEDNIFEVAKSGVYGVSAISFFNSIETKKFKKIKKSLERGENEKNKEK